MESVIRLTPKWATSSFAESQVANESESPSRKPHYQTHLFNAGTSKLSRLFQVAFTLRPLINTP